MHIAKQTILVGVTSLVVGAAAILGVRYFTYSPEKVHYHANFGVIINGQRETFKSPMYYEEESGSTCTLDRNDTRRAGTHAR